MDRTVADKLASNVATLADELDDYIHYPCAVEAVTSLATRICELANGHTDRLAAADALAEVLKRVYNINQSFLEEGYGCCFCKGGTGYYQDGEYRHSECCLFENISTALRQYDETR